MARAGLARAHPPARARPSRRNALYRPHADALILHRGSRQSALRRKADRRGSARAGPLIYEVAADGPEASRSFFIAAISAVSPLYGRTITLKPVTRPSSFHRRMSTPFTAKPSIVAVN